MLRTHTCGELTKKNVNKSVALCGWVNSKREHGKLTFINIRDRYGITQCVFDENISDKAHKLKNEDVIQIKGTVKARPDNLINKDMKTGEIELSVSELKILNNAEPLPLDISGEIESTEETRLKYRYLDLRRKELLDKFIIRHKAAQSVRNFLTKQNFIEVETPMLVRSTPEGARDYVVPSRVNKHKFYALPQSPQLYKQILMVAGFDRYFQLPRCLRDEDLRIDRQPEFTQIDVEMSFVDVDDVLCIVENLTKHIFKDVLNKEIKIPFPRFNYDQAMERYGIDKPDIRFNLELVNVSNILKNSDFSIFKSAVDSGGSVRCINAKGCANLSRKELDKLTDFVKIYKAKGLVYLKMDSKLDGPTVKFLSDDIQKKLIKATKAEKGDLLLFVADQDKIVFDALGNLRNHLGKKLKLYNPKDFSFVWVTDFPLFEWNEEHNRWAPMHHIFSMLNEDSMKYIESDPAEVRGKLYDLTLNGFEIWGGSIRIHRKDIQEKVLKVIGMDYKEAEQKFGFLLEAFKYGAPPHGGIACGFDRLVALMCGTPDIREVIAFPKNKNAQCPMDGSPSEIDKEQLSELNIRNF